MRAPAGRNPAHDGMVSGSDYSTSFAMHAFINRLVITSLALAVSAGVLTGCASSNAGNVY